MVLKLYTSQDGKPGEFVGEWDGLDTNLIRFCYENWPEHVAYKEAIRAWNAAPRKSWDDYPRFDGDRPPFEFQYPDGRWFEWQHEDSSDEMDAAAIREAEEEEGVSRTPVILDTDISCRSCKSNRVAEVSAKSSDLAHFTLGDKERDGYLPYNVGIGGGDYVEFSYCLDCGSLQGSFPLPLSDFEKGTEDGD